MKIIGLLHNNKLTLNLVLSKFQNMDTFSRDRNESCMSNLRKMLDNKIYTDCVLECTDGKIRAHRCVLMAANDFFYRAFTDNKIEDTLIHMEFDNVSIDILEILVNSMYGQFPSDLMENSGKMFKTMQFCHLIEEKFLLDYCMKLLTNQMTTENCIDVWTQAMQFQHREAEKCIMAFIIDNLILVIQDDKLIKASQHQLHELITYSMENDKCGDQLLQALIKWGKNNPKERLQDTIDLLNYLDKSTLTCGYVKKLLNYDWYVKNCEELTRILGEVHAKFRKSINDYKRSVQIQFYCVRNKEMLMRRYSLRDKEWCTPKVLNLPPSTTEWYPMLTVSGEQFYFSISNDKSFVVYCESNGEFYVGPEVNYETRVSGVVDGNLMFVTNYECIVQFNSVSKDWKLLSPIKNVLSPSNLLAVNGKLYFHAVFPPSISMYNFTTNEWELKRTLRETSKIRSIKCKCYRENCKGKLYFVANDKQLMSYDTQTEVWAVKALPELQCSVPLFMNCDESFIVLGNKHTFKNFYLYYPITNKWESFDNVNSLCDNVNLVTCDLFIK